jgi:hypothetical protein
VKENNKWPGFCFGDEKVEKEKWLLSKYMRNGKGRKK